MLQQGEREGGIGVDVGCRVKPVAEELLNVVPGVTRLITTAELDSDDMASVHINNGEGRARDGVCAHCMTRPAPETYDHSKVLQSCCLIAAPLPSL